MLLVPFAACWNPRYFTPREHVEATAPDGSPAALYGVPGDAGAATPAGELRVWSGGAKARFADDDREVVDLHVGFELENNSSRALQLDVAGVTCDDLMLDGVLQHALAPVRVEGDGSAAPGQTARVDFVFEPATEQPGDIESFAVRFAVRDGERVVLQQVTPFGPWVRSRSDDRYWGPWGFGWGFGLGWHGHCR